MESKDLLEKIKEEFNKRFKEKDGFVNYEQVQNYAIEIAEKSSKAVIDNFDDSLINEFGTLNYDILNEVLSDILESDYKLIADACVTAQTEMNKSANIGLKAIAPKYDDDRAHSIVWDMAQRDLNSFKQAYPTYTDNFYQSTVDEAVRANADFQWKARLEPKIVRIVEPTACKWCKSIEGTYKYEDVKDTGNDVFRRHTDCKCTVTYVPGKGKAKDVWSKREVSGEELKKRLDFVKEQEIKQNKIVYQRNNEKIIDVTTDFFKQYEKGKITFQEGFNFKDKEDEIKVGKFINKIFGGDLKHLTETNESTPDYLWKGKLWDLKNPSTENAISKRMQKGVNQILENPGGLILDMKTSKYSKKVYLEAVNKEMIKRFGKIGRGYCIVIDDDTLLIVLEYKK